MPLHLLEPWIVSLGRGLRISRVAALCDVSVPFARRRLRHSDFGVFVWDDVTPGAERVA